MTSAVVHLELHTVNSADAVGFLSGLLGWRGEPIARAGQSYLAMDMGDRIGGGIVECATEGAQWIPYVEVARIDEVTERANALGAGVLLEPRRGPLGWRSVVTTESTGVIALWQPKPRWSRWSR